MCLHVWLIRQFEFSQAPASFYKANNNEDHMLGFILLYKMNLTLSILRSKTSEYVYNPYIVLKKNIRFLKVIYNEYTFIYFFKLKTPPPPPKKGGAKVK